MSSWIEIHLISRVGDKTRASRNYPLTNLLGHRRPRHAPHGRLLRGRVHGLGAGHERVADARVVLELEEEEEDEVVDVTPARAAPQAAARAAPQLLPLPMEPPPGTPGAARLRLKHPPA